MRIITTGRQIGQAVKNVQRLRHITAVFARHGFVDVVNRMNLGKYLPKGLATMAREQAEFDVPVHLRKAFEELGPTFVKLGQLLSTRPDLLPENYIEEFTKLQDNVLPVPFEAIREQVESSLKKSLTEAYASFSKEPLASASMGQVHEAVLHTGEKVVVKVLRPNIREIVENDISILTFIAKLLEKYVPETKLVGPTVVVDEFFRTLSFEMDFVVEMNNMLKIAENMSNLSEIKIPTVYKQLSSANVLTLEKLEGIRFNDLKGLDAAGVDRKRVAQIGAKAFFKSIMIDGLFHGDLHGGNLFILTDGRIGIIDFGIVGRLSQRSRDQLANIVLSIVTEDYENLCYQYAEIGAADIGIDFDGFQRAVRNAISPYIGLNMSEVNSGKVLIEATKIATQYNVKVPGDWMLVFKAMLTTEGMARTLDPEFDLIATGETLIKDMVKSQYSFSRFRKEALWIAKDMAALLQILPRQIRWMLKTFNKNGFALEIKSGALQEIREQLEIHGKRTSVAHIALGFFVASAIALPYQEQLILGLPAFAFIYACAGAFFLWRWLRLKS